MSDAPSRVRPGAGVKRRGAEKLKRIPVVAQGAGGRLPKPPWIRVRLAPPEAQQRVRELLRASHLHTVCEEASCPNLPECFGKGTATFMIMGDICTRRCRFCDVASGVPLPLDEGEPEALAEAVAALALRYVVITSVDRDDLPDGGAAHFARCIAAVRARTPGVSVETLVPDFRRREAVAIERLAAEPPDVFNHNVETVPRLYRTVRPGADYHGSLRLLARFAERCAGVPTKSGLMLGLGEEEDEVLEVMSDLRARGVSMLTLGQYLQPSPHHLPVVRYWPPEAFERLRVAGEAMGFGHVAAGPMVRSSYHADRQASGVLGGGDGQPREARGVP